ncbi:MAG: hypothetical protein AMK69_26375 [Nitrospira bacterium SG8_3]|nr:MAG: hypothetical protein AMK69_26375 [Nitrospira bacterium SG8_3]
MSLVVGEIHGDIGEPGPDNGHEDDDKADIHDLLALYPLGLPNFEHNQKSHGKTKGHEKAVTVDGQGAYGEGIRKHGESVELLSR